MKKNILFCLIIALNLCSNFVNSQIIGNNNIPEIQPSNPASYEFLKYGEVPISKFTGTPDISIPIYSLITKGFDLPITLRYHTNGIKVNEESGWTGLGWTLNTGGHIVQIVNNYDDFGPYKNRIFPNIDEVADAVSNGSAPNGILNSCNGTFIGIDDSNLNLPIYDGGGGCGPLNGGSRSSAIPPEAMDNYRQLRPKDFEPDIFNFSVLGYTGTFVLNWSNEQFSCLTDSRIKIKKYNNSNDEIVISTPEGHHVIFYAYDVTKVYFGNDPVYSNYYSNEQKVTSRLYKIKEIYTNQNEHIVFSYTITNPIRNFKQKTSNRTAYQTTGGMGIFEAAGLNFSSTGLEIDTEQSYSFLNKITFNQGVIIFNSSNRIDIEGTKKLDEILVKTSENALNNIKKFDFSYSYFIGHTNGGFFNGDDGSYITSNEKTHRLKLNTLRENGKNPYIFEYDNTQLPQKTSYAQDYWGNYNGHMSNVDLYPNLSRFNYENTYFNSNSNNRSSNFQYAKASILQKIIYPTKGYTLFDYELNSFTNYIVPNYNDNAYTIYTPGRESYGNGLRIKKIVNYDHNNEIVDHKSYYYSNGKLSNPIRFYNKSYITNYEYKVFHPSTGQVMAVNPVWGFRVSLSTSNFSIPSINGIGNYVGYDKVTEEFISNKSEFVKNGKIEYLFENHINQGVVDIGSNSSLITDEHWKSNGNYSELRLPTVEQDGLIGNGSLLEKKTFNNKDSLVEKIIYKYKTYKTGVCLNGLRIGSILSKQMCGGYITLESNNYTRTYLLGVYPIRRINTHLISEEIISYYDNKEISYKEDYFYDYFFQLQKKVYTNSDGKNIEEQYTYHNNTSLNVISPIKTHKIYSNGKLVSNIENYYSFKNAVNGYHPNHTTGKIHIHTGFKDYISDITTSFSGHDNKGNFTDITQTNNGLKIKYIWDFHQKNLLLKIEGSDNITPPDSLVNTAISLSQNGDSQALRDALNAIRNSLPNAFVTSYTYSFLVGIRSITDPRGETIFYEYDTFNRLLHVKDKDGNILSKNEYNYKN